MSEFLRDESLKNDEGDDVEAHSLLKDSEMPMDALLKDDQGDDVEAHSLLGPNKSFPWFPDKNDATPL